MFAGIDVASERHVLARLDAQGVPLGKPLPITEDREGHDALLRLLGPPPVLVAMEATGHYWKNLYSVLVAAGHRVALLNPLKTRRFQDSALERTKTDAIDAAGIARFAFEKRPEATQLHDAAAEALRVAAVASRGPQIHFLHLLHLRLAQVLEHGPKVQTVRIVAPRTLQRTRPHRKQIM